MKISNILSHLLIAFVDYSLYQALHVLIPVLSAQLITAPTGKAKEILNFPPAEPPLPKIGIDKL